MPNYVFTKVYELSEVNWPSGMNVSNGAPIGTQFSVTGGGDTLTVMDDDAILEDNNNPGGIILPTPPVPGQSLDFSQQTLTADFGLNHAGDYVWSRAWQIVEDEYGNVGRIYQIRIGTWDHTLPPGVGVVDYAATNVHTYYAFTGPLVVGSGTTYTILSNFDGTGNQPYSTFEEPICFDAATLIETNSGLVAARDLAVGALVMTRDSGLQPIRWIGQRRMSPEELEAAPKLRPIRIRAGALGADSPSQDLIVSPQHRILVRSAIAQRMFGAAEVLVSAKQLVALDGVEVADDLAEVTYVHFLFDDHQVVLANGAEAESLYPGPEALRMIGPDAMDELLAIFPQFKDEAGAPARPLIPGRQARKLADRMVRNGRPLLRAM